MINVLALDVVVGIPAVRAHEYSGFARHDGPAAVVLDETDPVLLSGAFTQAVVERTELLTIHAAVVHYSEGVVAIPGPSGLGKSTLTAALVRAGFGLMSDEMLAIDRRTGDVNSFPRPITVDQRGRAVVGLPNDSDRSRGESVVPLADLGLAGPPRGRLVTIVIASRTAGSPLALAGVDASRGAAALIGNSFNHYRWPASSLATITRVTADADVITLDYPDAMFAAAALAKHARGPRPD